MDIDSIEDKDSIGEMDTINNNEGAILDNALDDAIGEQCIECLECLAYVECSKDKTRGCIG